MNKTIEPSMPWTTGSARGVELGGTAKLIAQWQSGPQTPTGYEQRKLRMVLARPPLAVKEGASCKSTVVGDNQYAIR
jgi:hypothetical protein